MKRALLFAVATAHAAEPDYSVWTRILRTYYDPAKGMDYSALKARDAAALTPKEQLAYWLNVGR